MHHNGCFLQFFVQKVLETNLNVNTYSEKRKASVDITFKIDITFSDFLLLGT